MQIFGHKTVAMLDLWTIEHFVNGIWCGYVAEKIIRKIFKNNSSAADVELDQKTRMVISFLIVLAAAMLWECVEHYVEAGLLPGMVGARVTHWFQGVEHWSNRLIGDTLSLFLGWFVFQKKKSLAIPAKIFSWIWLGVHIFIFPDSMYLHRVLFGCEIYFPLK